LRHTKREKKERRGEERRGEKKKGKEIWRCKETPG
jgi:hypothetical protein